MKFPNVVIPGKGPDAVCRCYSCSRALGCDLGDLEWIRRAWDRPIVIKGIHTRDDARRAVDVGVMCSSFPITAADNSTVSRRRCELAGGCGKRRRSIEVLLDGGIRRGSDIVKALCLGARAVMTGALMPMGSAQRVVPVLREQLKFCAVTSFAL